jgi:protein SCO1/2
VSARPEIGQSYGMPRSLPPALLGLLFLIRALAAASGNEVETPDFSGFDRDQAFAHSQAALGRQLSGVGLQRRDGSQVSIEDYRGKPLVISLIYTSCHHVCPSTTQYLQQVVGKARAALDDDSFQVVTIGFDTAQDSPLRMADFATRIGSVDPHWDFLSGDAASVAELVEQLGFIYYPSPKGFEHLVQASVVDEQGLVYRQVYGMVFPVPGLIEPLKELVFGEPRQESALDFLGDRIRLFCTVYDPATDSYRVDLSVFIGTFVGVMVCLVFGRALYKEWRRSLGSDA